MTRITMREALRLAAAPGRDLPPERVARLRERFAERLYGEALRSRRAVLVLLGLAQVWWLHRLWTDPRDGIAPALSAVVLVVFAIAWLALPRQLRRLPPARLGAEVERARAWLPPLVLCWFGIGALVTFGDGLPRLAIAGLGFAILVALIALLARRQRPRRWIDRDWLG
jgi:hypothetical protein